MFNIFIIFIFFRILKYNYMSLSVISGTQKAVATTVTPKTCYIPPEPAKHSYISPNIRPTTQSAMPAT